MKHLGIRPLFPLCCLDMHALYILRFFPLCHIQCSNYGKISGCPTDNQVTIFGCPSKFLVVRTWNTCTKVTFGYRFMVVCRTTASVFFVVRRRFWLSWAHRQPKFWMLVISFCVSLTKRINIFKMFQSDFNILASPFQFLKKLFLNMYKNFQSVLCIWYLRDTIVVT